MRRMRRTNKLREKLLFGKTVQTITLPLGSTSNIENESKPLFVIILTLVLAIILMMPIIMIQIKGNGVLGAHAGTEQFIKGAAGSTMGGKSFAAKKIKDKTIKR